MPTILNVVIIEP